jgi:hypothetical protein
MARKFHLISQLVKQKPRHRKIIYAMKFLNNVLLYRNKKVKEINIPTWAPFITYITQKISIAGGIIRSLIGEKL